MPRVGRDFSLMATGTFAPPRNQLIDIESKASLAPTSSGASTTLSTPNPEGLQSAARPCYAAEADMIFRSFARPTSRFACHRFERGPFQRWNWPMIMDRCNRNPPSGRLKDVWLTIRLSTGRSRGSVVLPCVAKSLVGGFLLSVDATELDAVVDGMCPSLVVITAASSDAAPVRRGEGD